MLRQILPPPFQVLRVLANSSIQRSETSALLPMACAYGGRALLCVCLVSALLMTGCSSGDAEAVRYAEMKAYHQESLTLHQVPVDSVSRFSQKVTSFVSQHPAAKLDPLYPQIQQNIQQASLRVNIHINGEWEGEEAFEF